MLKKVHHQTKSRTTSAGNDIIVMGSRHVHVSTKITAQPLKNRCTNVVAGLLKSRLLLFVFTGNILPPACEVPSWRNIPEKKFQQTLAKNWMTVYVCPCSQAADAAKRKIQNPYQHENLFAQGTAGCQSVFTSSYFSLIIIFLATSFCSLPCNEVLSFF